MTNSNHQEFGKYDAQGAYHWKQMRPSLRRFNAGLAARYEVALSILTANCPAREIDSVIDIGCGDGYFTSQLGALFPHAEIKGFDFSDTGIRLAKENCKGKNVTFHLGNAFAPEPRSISLITATDVIEHIDNYHQFLRQCHASLASGGHLLLSTPIRTKETPDDPYHVHEFFESELAEEVQQSGFEIVAHCSSHDYQVLANYVRRHSFCGIGRMRLGKYIANFKALVLKRNPFSASGTDLPTMQYLVARKT